MGVLRVLASANWTVVVLSSVALWVYVLLLRRGGALTSIFSAGDSERSNARRSKAGEFLGDFAACFAVSSAIAVGLKLDDAQGFGPAIVLAGKLFLVPCAVILFLAVRRHRLAEGSRNVAVIAIGVLGCAAILGAVA